MLNRWRSMRLISLLVLLLLLGALFPPVRARVSQLLVQSLLNGRLMVGSVQFQTDASLVEMRDVRAGHELGGATLRLSADRARLTLEGEPLWYRRFIVKSADIDGAELSLDIHHPVLRAAAAEDSDSQFLSQLARIQQQAATNPVPSLEAADRLAETWEQRAAQWLARSQALANQAASLKPSPTLTANPLRFDEHVRRQLEELQRLKDQQQPLLEQFSGVEKLLDSETNRLQEAYTAERTRWLRQLNVLSQDQAVAARVAERQLEARASEVWHELREFAQLGDYLTRLSTGAWPNSDRDASGQAGHEAVQVRRQAMPLAELQELRAQGNFVQASGRLPFRLQGSWQQTLSSDYRTTTSANWNLEFRGANQLVSLVISNRQAAPELNDIQITMRRREPNREQPRAEETAAELQEMWLQAVLVADGENIDGWLYAGTMDDAASAGAMTTQLSWQVSGGWQAPTCQLEGELPRQLLQSIEDELLQALAAAHTHVEQTLVTRFERRIQRLRQVIDHSLDAGQTVAREHEQQFAQIRAELEQSLEQQTQDMEFARGRSGKLAR